MTEAPPPQNALGALLLTTSWVFFTTEMVTVRVLSETLSVWQIASFRLGIQALAFLPMILWTRGAVLRTSRLPLHIGRALSSAAGMVLFYLAFVMLTFALATTITFMNAIFVMILAALFLGETLGPRRILAVIFGFVGVLVAMRPGVGPLEMGMLVALAGAFLAATLMIITRSLSSSESRFTIMAYSAWLGLAMIALPAALTWQSLETWHLPLLALVGVAGTTGQFLMVGAFQIAEVSALAPVDNTRLVFAVLAGFLVFGELPDAWTWAGTAIIVTAVAYATNREHLAAKAKA